VTRGVLARTLTAWWNVAQGADEGAAVERACEGADDPTREAVGGSVAELREREDLAPLREALAAWVARVGPNRAGPGGILQPVADALKLLQH
jgi:hypothetical protein